MSEVETSKLAMTSLPPLPSLQFPEDMHLTEETKNLLSSLPIENDWSINFLHQYQGFWNPTWAFQGVLDCQTHFEARPTDIFLATFPKTGTTWLKALVFAIVNRVQYKNGKNHPLLKANPHVLVPFLELDVYKDNQIPDLTSLPSPRLFATHLPIASLPISMKETACKIVYLSRDPKDTFVSLWHYTNKIRSEENDNYFIEDMFEKFCRGISPFGPYWDHVLGFWKESLENPKRVFFLKYEEMKENPEICLKRVAEFLGCPFSIDEEIDGVVGDISKLCSFDNLRSQEVNKNGNLNKFIEFNMFFRRGAVGDWINFMTPEMGERLDKIIKQKLQGSGLKF